MPVLTIPISVIAFQTNCCNGVNFYSPVLTIHPSLITLITAKTNSYVDVCFCLTVWASGLSVIATHYSFCLSLVASHLDNACMLLEQQLNASSFRACPFSFSFSFSQRSLFCLCLSSVGHLNNPPTNIHQSVSQHWVWYGMI